MDSYTLSATLMILIYADKARRLYLLYIYVFFGDCGHLA